MYRSSVFIILQHRVDITINVDMNCEISYFLIICSSLLKYHHYLLYFINDRPPNNVRDTDAIKRQRNLKDNRKN